MTLLRLDHVNVRTNDLATMIDWYSNVLGLDAGPRPDFSVPGAWLYIGDQAVVHLVSVQEPAGSGSESELKLEHFAFRGSDFNAFEARLRSAGVDFHCQEVPALSMIQCNVRDPDGNHVHIDFPVS